MKQSRRIISGLLSLAMTGSLCTVCVPAVAAAQRGTEATQIAQATGSIGLTLSFDLPQTKEEIKDRNIQLILTKGKESAVLNLESQTVQGDLFSQQQVTVVKQNALGAALTTEQRLGAYEVRISGLPTGDYTMTVTGEGYTTCSTEVELTNYSRHVLMGTGDGTFTLGDFDGDGDVDQVDRTALSEKLGTKVADQVERYDLNGDAVVDITDLSYVNRVLDQTGTPKVLSTAAIVTPTVDKEAVTATSGSLEDLFTANDSVVTVAPGANAEALSIPMVMEQAVEMKEISITTPNGVGAIQAGTALVVLSDDSTMEIPFDAAAPAGVLAISRVAGQSVINIDLGKKVAVKKVTITVTQVDGQEGEKPQFAAITQIEFLKDIVSEETKADSQVTGLAATAGDEQVYLVWNSVKNVTGYEVRYGTGRDALNQSLSVGTNKATVSGLKNDQTYYFQVTATSEDWSGTPSTILSAVPVAASVPGAPSNLVVEPANTALRVSWGNTKNAAYYQVFYRVQGESSFQQWGGDMTATSAVITGLTNDVVYEVAVKAGNHKGVGPYSSIALGTPAKESLEMPALPEYGRIDNGEITSIVMADPNNVNWGMCPKFNVKTDLTDHDPNTYWIANNYWYNSSITFTFASTHSMNYLLVVPYLDAAYKNRIANYTVTLTGEDGQVLATYYRDGMNITSGNYYILSFPETQGVKSVTVALGEKAGGPRVSISEIAFYESDMLAEQIAGLFTDNSFTKLKSGVDGAQIAALQEKLNRLDSFYLDVDHLKDEVALALALTKGDSSALGLVKEDFQSRSAAADQSFQQTASDLQPLGITARAGATVAIYAQLPEDATVYVVPTQFYGESGVWKGTPVALQNGRNYITVEKIGSLSDTRGGPLYLTYAGSHPEDIKIQVRVRTDAWEMPVLELSDWYNQTERDRKDIIRTYVQELTAWVEDLEQAGITRSSLKNSIRNATEIATPSVLLSLPADQVLSGLMGVGNDEDAMVSAMYQNVLAWEEELFVANKVQGILDSDAALSDYHYPMTTRQNIRYMRMFAGAFMYAAGNHIGVEYGSTAALVQGKPSAALAEGERENGLFGWGIAHEIGHNMDKLGKAETTNNLYSLFLQAWDGGAMQLSTRLTEENRWEAIFNKVAQGRPGVANNVFVQLGMYWQLHLAYDEGTQPMAFYNEFFQLWKAGEYSGYSYDERVALIASEVAQRDLTQFFTRWGMVLSDEVKEILGSYRQENRAIWYLNDAARNYRLENGSRAAGSASVTASVKNSQVTLSIRHTDEDKILGYEIRRNGTPIAFTTENTYVDDLGAANNLTYTYSVVPVDQLGNLGEEALANEVRVAYDKALDADLYDMERAGTTVTFTMKNGAALPVTGIKVTGTDLDGKYTVKVKAEADAQNWTYAKTGTLSGESTVAYFHKPGADSSDTRIWTYDAAVIEITGIAEDAQVQLLDYPGDRVDFYEGAAVGILREDYQYGDGADEVIEAGTLVILGTYRGDPTYNYVSIEARYNRTPEAGEATENGEAYVEREMSGYGLLFAEIPEDGAVSDTSDGFFLFVPNMTAEKKLNQASGVTDDYPVEIRANFYRTDDPDNADRKRLTSRTLWLSFPDGGDQDSPVALPEIVLTGSAN